MFEVGFWELVLVGLVALLVFGPERLPRVAREAALWIKKARAVVSSVKEDIHRELELQDLKQSLLEQKRLMDDTLTHRAESASRKSEQPTTEENADGPD
ncbi:MAG TPA: Sec-independent protein translocase protein TatB [Methylococcaceae bacterium]|jgi:sec-independent protein translocase protein TatB|nr:Sec-independent protein translocase protein TatB [Methylococcaceae bacterium]